LIFWDDREGLTAIISVKVAEPQFEGQTKTKLEKLYPVSQAVSEMIENYLKKIQMMLEILFKSNSCSASTPLKKA
jgi:DNA gyrase/topoisomerase IV subunit B